MNIEMEFLNEIFDLFVITILNDIFFDCMFRKKITKRVSYWFFRTWSSWES